MSTASITLRTRQLIQDTGRPFAANVVVDGASTIFDLPVESISATTEPLVLLDGIAISGQATPPYIIDYKHGVLSFITPPGPPGVTLGVQGITYDFFDDDEVSQAVTDAFNLHVADQDPLPVINPQLGQCGIPPTEELLVAILAAVDLLWIRATDSAQLMDIHTPEGVTIPQSELFKQILEQINALTLQYKEWAGALGVGLYRIQILNQRRVSYTTNRLVPIFREQEYNTPYSGFWPTAAPVGAQVTVYGKYFTGATAVTFGGVPATQFIVVDDETITATVPVGAVTGQIGITTPSGAVLSTAQFVVGQPAPFVRYGPELVHPPVPPGV